MRTPKYRKHSTRNLGFCEWQGKRHYFPGPYDSFESREAYRRFLREHVFAAREIAGEVIAAPGVVTVAEVADRFLTEAAQRYGVDPYGEYANVELTMRYWVRHSGPLRVGDFGSRRLKEFRAWRLEEGDSARYVNSHVGRIKRALRWAVSEEMIPASVVTTLEVVQGLPTNGEKRKPVEWRHVEAVLPHVGDTIRDMILLQWYTGARSRSLCWACPSQFDRTQQPWLWRPVHKTERKRKTPLILPVGPKAQAVILPYFDRAPDAPLFSPREVAENRRYGTRYTPRSYRQAIVRGIDRANEAIAKKNKRRKNKLPPVPHWYPYQLRHSRGQLVRDLYGVEAAQAILGHESLDATEIYTTRILALAVKAAQEIG